MRIRFRSIFVILITLLILSTPISSMAQDRDTLDSSRITLYNSTGSSIFEGEFTESDLHEHSDLDEEILRIPEVCNGLPYHAMRSKGFGRVTLANESIYIRSGACFQCSGCNRVMVTEGDPLKGYQIGKYAWVDYYYSINDGGANIDIPQAYGVWYSSTMNGYKFLFRKNK